MGFFAVLLGVLFCLASALGPPPCGKHEIELYPAKCGKTEHGTPIGKATGSYCATRCNATELCPTVKGTNATCSMTQQSAQHYCEYHCAEDVDCPSLGNINGSCQLNIDNKICTYPGDIYAGDGVNTVAYSPDGTHLASGGDDYTVKIWNVAMGKLLHTLTGHEDRVNGVAYSPDGEHLASGSDDQTIKIWHVATGRVVHTLTGVQGVNVAYNPDGTHLASGGERNTVKIWDVATGKVLHTFTGHKDDVNSVAYSPAGEHLASGSDDQTINIWDVATGKVLHTLTGHKDYVQSVAYSPDGTHLASGGGDHRGTFGGGDNTVKIWDVATGKLLHTITGHIDPDGTHRGSFFGVVYSPDGKHLASASYTTDVDDVTGLVDIWDVATGKSLYTFTGPSDVDPFGLIKNIAYSPDGKHLAFGAPMTGYRDEKMRGTIRIHDVATRLAALSHDIAV